VRVRRFSAVWTSLPQLLTGPTYRLTTDAVGALGLLSASTMICAPLAGRMADRVGPDPVNLACLLGAIAAAGVLAAGTLGGPAGLITITVGVLLLDVTMQSGNTANVTRVYAIGPEQAQHRVHDLRLPRRQHRFVARRPARRRPGLGRSQRTGGGDRRDRAHPPLAHFGRPHRGDY
jgi:hypothetical protein